MEFQRRRGAPHLHVLIQLDVPFLSAPEYADWQRWLTESWGRCLGLPAPYATRIEALRERDFRYARAYAVKTEQKTFPFPGRWGRVWGCGGSYSGALLPVLRLSASSSFCLMWRPISSLGLWAYPLLRNFPAPSHHARLPEARGRGLDMREGPGLPVRSDGSLPRESLFCLDVLCGTAPEPLCVARCAAGGRAARAARFAPYPLPVVRLVAGYGVIISVGVFP